MVYEKSDKHCAPWKRGISGSLCPKEITLAQAQQLLEESEMDGRKRYMVFEGRAFCAQEHLNGKWHGYPVGWREVPPALRKKWLSEARVIGREIKNNWNI